MAIHFERSATQSFIENALGCSEPKQFPNYIDELREFKFSLTSQSRFALCVEKDIQGQFERHCLALMQASAELETGSRLWPIVKLYYSVFYCARAELHLFGMSIIRCKQIYIASGSCQSGFRKFNNNEKGDHGITLEIMRKKVGENDILQTQSIDGENVYTWMKNLREIAQYKMRRPVEVTNFDPFFDISTISVVDQVSMYLGDNDPLFCFDPDYAALAIPVTRFKYTLRKIKSQGINLGHDFKAVAATIAKSSSAANLIYSHL